ncbi:Uncharacterized protein At4g06744 [Linum perenne]
MPTKSSSFLLFYLILSTLLVQHLAMRRPKGRTKILPVPVPPPPPANLPTKLLSFADARLAVVYPVIQKFKSTITSDPLGITSTWVGSDLCKYKGFFCDNPPDNSSATTVASIDFNGFHLSAPTLDGFVDQLPDIALFHANSNFFSGTISSTFSNLPYLYELDISNNLFSGPFPSTLLRMNGLEFLDLRFNSFTGSVPPQIYVQNLEALFLNDNEFVTSLPFNLDNTRIMYLTLANNKLTGPIPGSIFKSFASLTEVLLLNNQLTGCLPYEVGMLKEAVVFDIGNNQLTGLLPLSLACLEKVEQLNFAGNEFYGVVPDLICKELGIFGSVNMSLAGNYFTGIGSSWCMDLIQGGLLDVTNNCIPGLPGQRSFIECAMFLAKPKLMCPRPWSYAYIPCGPLSLDSTTSSSISGSSPTP